MVIGQTGGSITTNGAEGSAGAAPRGAFSPQVRRNSGRPTGGGGARRPSFGGQGGQRSRGPAPRGRGGRGGEPHSFDFPRVGRAVQPVAPGTLRIIPIGGCEEVGRNMTIFEYENDIVLLDMGLQFPEDNMPGIDYIIPNIKYLQGKEHKVRGVVFSHGHLDHIGAAPILLEKLNYPPVIAMPLTVAMVKHRVEDYRKGAGKNVKSIMIKTIGDVIQLGAFRLRFFQVEHSIMDSMGTILETPAGSAIHLGDWTMEREADGETHIKYDHLATAKRPSVLMLESLGALKEGRHATHEEMYKNLHDLLSNAPGRIIMATFASQVERVKWVIEAANKLGKKVALGGFSMKKNIEIAKELGYVKPAKDTLIDIRQIDDFPEKNVVIVCTGGQGEENAVLNRIVMGEHREVKFRKSDTVIFSSSVIPGNERSVQRLKDNIYRQCDHVIHGDLMDVHVSGHGTRRDIIDMIEQSKPDYFMPVYGNHFFLKEAQQLAIRQGFKAEKTIVPDNGYVVDLTSEKVVVQKEKAPSDYVFVDGLGISDSQHVVLRDRQVLAEDGMLVIIATVDTHKGILTQNPDIISRGFVFMKDNKKLIEDIRARVKKLVTESDPKSWADTNQIRNDIRDKIGQFVFTKTEKRPMVLPVVIEV